MNLKIWKYNLTERARNLGNSFKLEIPIEMPHEAQLLDAGILNRDLYIWAMHEIHMEKTLVERKFFVAMTNEELDLHYLWKYFRTVRDPDVSLTYHLFHYHR